MGVVGLQLVHFWNPTRLEWDSKGQKQHGKSHLPIYDTNRDGERMGVHEFGINN
jgi:hypothetical protein